MYASSVPSFDAGICRPQGSEYRYLYYLAFTAHTKQKEKLFIYGSLGPLLAAGPFRKSAFQ